MPDFRLNCWFFDWTAGFQSVLPRLERREAAGVGDGSCSCSPHAREYRSISAQPDGQPRELIEGFPKRVSTRTNDGLRAGIETDGRPKSNVARDPVNASDATLRSQLLCRSGAVRYLDLRGRDGMGPGEQVG